MTISTSNYNLLQLNQLQKVMNCLINLLVHNFKIVDDVTKYKVSNNRLPQYKHLKVLDNQIVNNIVNAARDNYDCFFGSIDKFIRKKIRKTLKAENSKIEGDLMSDDENKSEIEKEEC